MWNTPYDSIPLKKATYIFSLFFIFLKPVYPIQTSQIDSLKTEYQTAIHDTTKAKLLLELVEHIYLHSPDSVIPLCQEVIEIIDKNLFHANPQEEIFLLHNKAVALNNIGLIHNQQGDIEKGLENYFKSLRIFEDFFLPESQKKWGKNLNKKTLLKSKKTFKKGLASAYIGIGFIYDDQGEIEKALEYYFLSLKIQEEIKDKKGMADSYNNIGAIYSNQGEIEKTLKYYFLSLKIKEEIKDIKGMADSYNNIGLIYKNQGEIEKGLEYYFLSLKIREEIKDKIGMANSYHNIGNVVCKLDSLEEGIKYLELGLKLVKELEYKSGISASYSTIGAWQLKLGQVEAALESGLEALIVAKEVGHVDYMGRAARLLSNVYKKQDKFKDAFAMYELEIQMRDSIVNEENQKATIRQQMKYEYEKAEIIKAQKEKAEARILAEAESRRNSLHYSAIAIVMVLLSLSLFALGFVKVSAGFAEGLIFISFLIFFEFILVFADPYIENWTGGAPGYKLLFNALIAGIIFPLHSFFEGKLKQRIIKTKQKKFPHEIIKCIAFLLLISYNSLAQANTTETKHKIDSLKTAYTRAMHDSTRISILLSLGEAIYLSNPDSALILWTKARDIADNCLTSSSRFTELELITLKKSKAEALVNMGYIYGVQGNPQLYLEYALNGVEIFENLLAENFEKKTFLGFNKNIKNGLAGTYNNIGFIYYNHGEIKNGLEYFFKCLKIREEIKDKQGMAVSYNNIGFIHCNQGEIKKGLEYYFKSLKIREDLKDKQGMAQSYHNVGSVLCEIDSIEKGMKFLKTGLVLAKKLGDKNHMGVSYSSLGGWQLKLGQVGDALESGQQALELAKEVGFPDNIKRAARLLSRVYRKQTKFEQALEYYELEVQMRDSIVNEEHQKATIRQQMKYEYEKEQIRKEHEAKEKARIEAEVTARRDELHYTGMVIGLLFIGLLVAMLGFIKVSPKAAEGIIFIAFLIFFEFLLVLLDPYIEQWTGGAPGYKLLFNALLAGLIFPLHQFFEGRLKKSLIKVA
ncbi:tetratricopeptide repeat protein, partial [Candidatus Amoebophilus asiaticus]|nr:tetratricopeptide repeat protein [Candidatus Amoebophilus asiaticus]